MTTTATQTPLLELWPVAIDWDLAFTRPQMRRACAYWQSLCDGRRMPARRELNPRAMKEFLPYVNLVNFERRDGSAYDYIVTLQCNHARDILGNVENKRLSDVLPSAIEQRWRSSFDLTRLNAAPVRLTTRASTLAKNWLSCEILLAPLGQNEEVEAIFWTFVTWPITPDSMV
jgi:hypothetical protein